MRAMPQLSQGSAGGFAIIAYLIASENATRQKAPDEDYAALALQIQRRGLKIEELTERAMAYSVAVPTWGVGTGGTRFARCAGPGEPRSSHDKLEDCGVINRLTRATNKV